MSATTVNPPVIPATSTIDPATATTAQLAEAIVAAKTAPAVPVAAPQPVVSPADGYTISSGDGGQMTVKLETGEVFKGTQDEVLQALAKAQYHSHKAITELRTAATVVPAAPIQPVAPVIDDVGREILNLVAPAMGLKTGDEVVAALNELRATGERSGADRIATEFMSMCPEFPSDDTSLKILFDKAGTLGLSNMNAQALKVVHQSCVANGDYAPLTPDQIRQSHERALNMTPSISYKPPVPSPVLMAGASQGTSALDPRTMPIDELAALVRRGGK